jgi:hypothetical protein
VADLNGEIARNGARGRSWRVDVRRARATLRRKRVRFERLRYRLWWWLSERKDICPATSHSRVVWGIRDAALRIDSGCLQEGDASCWCGKVRADEVSRNGGSGA